VKGFAYRRVKNDVRDAADLADLLRMGCLPEAWVAPHQVREMRELTRCRVKLVRLRTSCKDLADHRSPGRLSRRASRNALLGLSQGSLRSWPG
jgi:transposase